MQNCPECGSTNCVKNGSIHNGRPKNQCNACGHQFVNDPENAPVSEETKELIDKLLLEKIPLAGIVRVTAVSERWLQNYVNETYENVPKQLVVRDKSKDRVTLQCDEMWSFVDNKGHKQWIWLTMDVDSREIVDLFGSNRDKEGTQEPWASLPAVYRQCAVAYTDFWEAYAAVFPTKRHRARRPANPVTSNASIAPYVNEYRALFVRHSPSPKSWKPILALFGILSIITTLLSLNHYLCRTTPENN